MRIQFREILHEHELRMMKMMRRVIDGEDIADTPLPPLRDRAEESRARVTRRAKRKEAKMEGDPGAGLVTPQQSSRRAHRRAAALPPSESGKEEGGE